MKKTILTLLLLIFPTTISAASECSYEEQANLTDGANLIKVSYKEMEGIVDPDTYVPSDGVLSDPDALENYEKTYNYFDIEILNMTEDYYIVMKNDINSDVVTINFSDLNNGIYVHTQEDLQNIYSYTFEIYSSSSTGCEDEVYGIKYLTTPKLNFYALYDVCESYQDEAICQKYTTIEGMNDSDFFDKISDLDEQKETQAEDDQEKGESSNIIGTVIWFIIITLLIISGVVLLVMMQKRRRKL